MILSVNSMVTKRQNSRFTGRVSIHPTVRQQLRYSSQGIMGDIAIHYDVIRELDAGELIVIILKLFYKS